MDPLESMRVHRRFTLTGEGSLRGDPEGTWTTYRHLEEMVAAERERCAKIVAAMEEANIRESGIYENQIRAQAFAEAKRRIREARGTRHDGPSSNPPDSEAKEGGMGDEQDGERWAWIGGEKFTTLREGGGIRFVTLQDTRTALAAERDRCEQLFLAYAADAHGWKLKGGQADEVRMMLEDIRSGAAVHKRCHFVESCPDNHGLPAIVDEDQATLQEAHGPSSNPPDSEASADSCERNGGTASPDTSG